jgi:HK97 family phage portal protein
VDAAEPWADGLLHDQPNPDSTAPEFWEAVIACMALEGNAYGFKMTLDGGGKGKPLAVELINPSYMNVSRYPGTRELRFRFKLRGKDYDVGAEQIIHWKGFSLGGDTGLSAIRYNANTLGIAMAADDTAGKMFANGAHTAGFVQTPVVLKDDQRKQFNESLDKYRNSDAAGKIMLLEGGFEFKPLGINPDDMEMLKSRGFSVEEVCRIFRVPPFMVGHTEKNTSWGSGLEQQLIAYVTFALLPYLKKIQSRNNLGILTDADRRAGYYTEFNVDALLQADSAARASFYQIMARNGFYTRDDVRVKENLPRKGGGADVLTVESALTSIDNILLPPAAGGGGLDANATRNALRAFLGITDPPALPAPGDP